MLEYDVIIIGGGITGVGIARDCSLRGLKVLLVERKDLTNGATGRNHGLLHSGARYAVNDPESALECARENRILRRIASRCVEQTGGLFLSLPEDGLEYQDIFVKACAEAGIKAEVMDPAVALLLEPSANPDIIGAVRVPDAAIDPFRLTSENALDATLHGADIRTYTEVTGLVMDRDRVVGVKLVDTRSSAVSEAHAPITVNAAGIWSQKIAAMAGCNIHMLPAKGSLLIFGHRVNRMVLNRCRKPSNADILVPGDMVCMLGTSSSRVSMEECDNLHVTAEEVDMLMQGGLKLSPMLSKARVMRAYAGVRPLVSQDTDSQGRSVSRGIVILDHQNRDGVSGFITVTGGKLTSYRLMGEKATDLVCSKLGVDRKCLTDRLPLPDSMAGYVHGDAASSEAASKSELLCKCERVTREDISYAVKNLDVHNLIDLRRRTRVGMGICQGSFCMQRVAQALAEELGCPDRTPEFVREYVGERWKGIAPICWGESLREAEYMRKLYGQDEI